MQLEFYYISLLLENMISQAALQILSRKLTTIRERLDICKKKFQIFKYQEDLILIINAKMEHF